MFSISPGIRVSDRNGSLDTNESSSPETNTSDVTLDDHAGKNVPANTLFDFNEFFRIDNSSIPGLSVSVRVMVSETLSRFGLDLHLNVGI